MKVKHVTGESLHGGPERSLCETVEVKPELCWRPKDVGDARAVGYLQGERGAQREWEKSR